MQISITERALISEGIDQGPNEGEVNLTRIFSLLFRAVLLVTTREKLLKHSTWMIHMFHSPNIVC